MTDVPNPGSQGVRQLENLIHRDDVGGAAGVFVRGVQSAHDASAHGVRHRDEHHRRVRILVHYGLGGRRDDRHNQVVVGVFQLGADGVQGGHIALGVLHVEGHPVLGVAQIPHLVLKGFDHLGEGVVVHQLDDGHPVGRLGFFFRSCRFRRCGRLLAASGQQSQQHCHGQAHTAELFQNVLLLHNHDSLSAGIQKAPALENNSRTDANKPVCDATLMSAPLRSLSGMPTHSFP